MIQGPIGTSQRFKNAVIKLVLKGKTDLQARRIVASNTRENAKRK